MTCKDCIHYDVCENYLNYQRKTIQGKAGYLKVHKKKCPYEKDKSKYIELPCNIGDKVYHIIREIEITEESIYRIRVYEDNHIAFSACRKGGRIVFNEDEIGKTVFLTKSEAEQKLKELQNGDKS